MISEKSKYEIEMKLARRSAPAHAGTGNRRDVAARSGEGYRADLVAGYVGGCCWGVGRDLLLVLFRMIFLRSKI
jgi:hypothetical protein